MLTVGSLFSGIGGFDRGFAAAGYRIGWQVEIDRWCQRVLARHWPDVPRHGDIRDVQAPTLAPVDVVAFGSPCQDLSLAGRRAGLYGSESGLFFEATRLIGELRPAVAVWENVVGALSSHGGRDFGQALNALADCGFMDIGWRVMDSRYFGVAQRRRRVYVVASRLRGLPSAVLFEPASSGGDPTSRGQERQSITAALTAGPRSGRGPDDNAAQAGWVIPQVAATPMSPPPGGGYRADAETETLIAFAWQQGNPRHVGDYDRSRIERAGDYVGAISTTRVDALAYDRPLYYTHDHSGDRVYGTAGTVPALTAQTSGQARKVLAGLTVRRLCPDETELLQGFPVGWTCLCGTEPYSLWTCRCPDSPRYRGCGNAVTVPVARWLAARIAAALTRDTSREETPTQ